MRISIKHRFAFFCMPKCASGSTKNMLDPVSDILFNGRPPIKHLSYQSYEAHLLPFLSEVVPEAAPLETLCIMREPCAWLHSWFRFRSREALQDPNHFNHDSCTAGISFSEFVEAHLAGDQAPKFARVGRQTDFVRDKEGKVAVDKLFAYERLDLFKGYMEKKTGESLELRHKNVSPKMEFDLEPQLLEKLKSYLSSDYQLYDSLDGIPVAS